MNSFAIYGASDDLVELESDGKPHDEMSPPKSFAFVAGGKSLHARLSFDGKRGTGWKLSVELSDESESGALPFDVRIVQERYSPKLIVENVSQPVMVLTGTKTIGTLLPVAQAIVVVPAPGDRCGGTGHISGTASVGRCPGCRACA